MTAALVRDPDAELSEYLAAWRADILSVPLPPMYGVRCAVAAFTGPGDHMPTVLALRVVEPRFPRLAAAVRWVTTVGAVGVATGCLAAAAVLTAGMRAGVLR